MEKGRGIPDTWGNNKAPNNLSLPRFLCICWRGLFGLSRHALFGSGYGNHKNLITKKKAKWESTSLTVLSLTFFLLCMINDIPPCFLSPLHSPLSIWAMCTWLISSTCSLWMVSAQNRSMQIYSPNISSHPRPLVSLDTTYEVNFTLSSLITAPISRCL